MYDKVRAGSDFAYKTKQTATCPAGFSSVFSIQQTVVTVRQVPGNKLGISKLGWSLISILKLFNYK